MTPRACRVCGGPIVRRDNERPDKFRHRRCCSRVCGAVRRDLAAAERKAGIPTAAPRVFPSGWPQITDPDQERLSRDAYAPYELRVRPQPGRLPLQPATPLVRGSALAGE